MTLRSVKMILDDLKWGLLEFAKNFKGVLLGF